MNWEDVKEGDYIYYYKNNGDTCPGKILKIGLHRIHIIIDTPDKGTLRVWVNPDKIELQEA